MRWPALTVIGILAALLLGALEALTFVLLDLSCGWRNRQRRRLRHAATLFPAGWQHP